MLLHLILKLKVNPLKKIISILLIFLVLLQPMSKLWIVMSFKINQDFIAKVLCINRDKPKLACAGKCHLTQKLKEAEEKDQEQVPPSVQEKTEVFLCNAQRLKVSRVLIDTYLTADGDYVDFVPTGVISDVFHPPQVS